jgi:hypothetical protein
MVHLIPISSGSDQPRGDVVFVHGIHGHARKTWEARPGSFWPDWLAKERPDLAIWSLSYEILTTDLAGHTICLPDRATKTLAVLDAEGLGARPLCFITHGMGGLLVKQILRDADTFGLEYQHISKALRGIVFLATPNAGSDLASWGRYLSFMFGTTVTMRELEAHGPQLRTLNLWFRDNVDRLNINVRVLYETQPTKDLIVVDAISSDPGLPGCKPIPVDANHFNISKPANRAAFVYQQARKFVAEVLPHAIDSRNAAVTRLRRRLLAARGRREIRGVISDIERLLKTAPDSTDVRLLLVDAHEVHASKDRAKMRRPIHHNAQFFVVATLSLIAIIGWAFWKPIPVDVVTRRLAELGAALVQWPPK